LLYVHDTEASNYLLFANGKGTVLVDCKGGSPVDDAVFEQGYTYIDAYVITACTEDSVLRLKSTLHYTPIDTLYLPAEKSIYTAELEQIAMDSECKIRRYPARWLYIGGLTIYTSADEDTPGYVINACHNGGDLMVFGNTEGVDGYHAVECDGTVFTRECAYAPVPQYKLPESCGKAYLGGKKLNYIYSYLTHYGVADSAEFYESNLILRFGKDGVIKE
jgi:hypothetical protein